MNAPSGRAALAKPKPRTSTSRLSFLDWLRGVAAVVMLQGHVFHSFTGKEYRDGSVYILSQSVGGMPPAIFLFLTGVTLAFLMDSCERKSLTQSERWVMALRRAGYLLMLAYLFRLQLWLVAWPKSPFSDVWKVDILNCMGLSIAALSGLSVFSTSERIRLGAVLGVAAAALAPLVSALDFSGFPALVKMYLAPDFNYFSFFPWAAFLAFGLSFGSLLRVVREDNSERLMHWIALLGFALILAGQFFGGIPFSIYPKSDFWLDSPALTFIKLGVIFVALAAAFVWNRWVIRDRWNWLRQIGTTSLLIYWVHIELVYGRWFWWWKENLNVTQTLGVAVFVVLLMLYLSLAQTNWAAIRAWLASPRLRPAATGAEAD
ncbi:MAG: DUF1624 domain-containing protein [Acidobacteria bacterium]|nr:DUF1624 domain-containing protein [Acidobacteriota bacterium]